MDSEKRAAENAAETNGATGEPDLAELLRAISGGSDSSSQSKQNSPQGADMLTRLMSDPEILAKLPTIISMIKPMMSAIGSSGDGAGSTSASSAPKSAVQSEENSGHGSAKEGDGSAAALAAFESLARNVPRSGGTSDAAERRARLLYAIKPYLSEDRQNAIDYMIKLSRLGDILKSL